MNTVTKDKLFILSTVALLAGCTILGIGIGKLFEKCSIGFIVGMGIGLISVSINSIYILKKIIIFNKKEI